MCAYLHTIKKRRRQEKEALDLRHAVTEHLPQELRDRFIEIRKLDIQVQNSMDSLEKREKNFYTNAKKMKIEEQDKEFTDIMKIYYKTLEDADEKVHIAKAMHDLVDRYLRRLDVELYQFKMELEAGNKGITEVLEKRSLELDQPTQSSCNQNKNRYVRSSLLSNSGSREERRRVLAERRSRESNLTEKAHINAEGNATAAAASQAIATTQQMKQGRRTASLKASYEAINTGVQAHKLSTGRELAGAAHTALQATHEAVRKHKKEPVVSPVTQEPIEEEISVADSNSDDENSDVEDDPNEPRYCICNKVSYGNMVACDNEDCPIEWFHFRCVHITSAPKGKWFCPQCTASMRRKGSRKN